jgi:CheY-like chemotaxis protein
MNQPIALILDDSVSTRFVLSRFLSHMGWHTESGTTLQEGLQYLQKLKPDVIFADHHLPGADPDQLVGSLLAQPQCQDVPVIICFGDEAAGFEERALAAGAAAVIEKPITSESLAGLFEVPDVNEAIDEASLSEVPEGTPEWMLDPETQPLPGEAQATSEPAFFAEVQPPAQPENVAPPVAITPVDMSPVSAAPPMPVPPAAPAPDLSATVEELHNRVAQLESELNVLRQEFGRLVTGLRAALG